MKTQATELPGVTLIHGTRYDDERGSFRPIFAERLHDNFKHPWAEMNLSHTERNCIRGLHFQSPFPQAKLITVVSGTIFDVVVDLRPGPHFARHLTFELSAENPELPSQIHLPEGLAHGIATPHGPATIAYLVSRAWAPETEKVLAWNDPHLAINWPLSDPKLSTRDQAGKDLQELAPLLGQKQTTE